MNSIAEIVSRRVCFISNKFPEQIEMRLLAAGITSVGSLAEAKHRKFVALLDYISMATEIFYLIEPMPQPFKYEGLLKEWTKRCKSLRGKSEPLAKAVGLPKHKASRPLRVLDLTAGFGRDAVVMAYLGCEVMMVEVSLPLNLLLEEALVSLSGHYFFKTAGLKVALIEGDHKSLIETEQVRNFKPDAIYYDPMFPEQKKSAQVKKEMQLLQSLVGTEKADFNWLLALQQQTARLVIKRPVNEPPLLSQPTFALTGKRFRMDVYQN